MTDEEPIIEVIHSGEEIILEEIATPPFPRLKVIAETDKLTLEEKLDTLLTLGYTLNQSIEIHPELNATMWAVLVLKEGKYADVVELIDVSPNQVTEYLKNGWEAPDPFQSTKFVRMIRRGVQPEGE